MNHDSAADVFFHTPKLGPEPLHSSMLLRMTDTRASEAGRALVAARWGPAGTRDLSRAVETVISRAGQLTPEQRAEVGAAIDGEADPDE